MPNIRDQKARMHMEATSKAFMDREAKRKSWIGIGMNMFGDWETFSIKVQEEKSK